MYTTSLVVIGRSTRGKTRTAILTSPEPFVLQCDNGGDDSVSASDIPAHMIRDIRKEENPFTSIEEVVKEIADGDIQCKTLIWDGLSSWTRQYLLFNMEYIAKKEGLPAGIMPKPEWQHYQQIKLAFYELKRKIDLLPINKIFITLTKLEKIDEKHGDKIATRYVPVIDTIGSLRDDIQGHFGSFLAELAPTTIASSECKWIFKDKESPELGKSRIILTEGAANAPRGEESMEPNFCKLLWLYLLQKHNLSAEEAEAELTEQYGSLENFQRVYNLTYKDMVRT